MPKEVKESAIARGIKTRYLTEHLKQAEEMIIEWRDELKAPAPFSPQGGVLGWESAYRPLIEVDPDNNHTLRSHVKSRVLWRHHTDWERGIARIWLLIEKLREATAKKLPYNKADYPDYVWKNYIGTALLAAFETVYREKPFAVTHKSPQSEPGVLCGDYLIDMKASDKAQRQVLQDQHSNLITTLVKKPDMKELIKDWKIVKEEEERMNLIVTKIIKARDILYPCRFCKHLWK
ncbi:hypothetical protein ACFLWU_06135 [Chloroflexota bacterium]